MKIRPISYREAADYINKNHRHHKAPPHFKAKTGQALKRRTSRTMEKLVERIGQENEIENRRYHTK